MTATSFWQHPFQWTWDQVSELFSDPAELARDVLTGIADWFSGLELVDWVLLALGASFVAWVVLSLRAVTRLGPIDVEPLEHDSSNGSVPTKALTGLLAETLSHMGLNPAPAVPAGTPSVNLMSAIKESGIPNANWIASLVELVPRPRPSEYKIKGVLFGSEPGDPPDPARCGVRYSVLPGGDGSADLGTVDDKLSFVDVLSAAAPKIYLHIAHDATGAFPIWARWHESASLKAYALGIEQRRKGDVSDALASFQSAADQEQFNVLARLQIANLYERSAPVAAIDPSPLLLLTRAVTQAEALGRYLQIADDWPGLVEARYRASIVAAGLAATLDMLSTPLADFVMYAVLGIAGDTQTLHDIAEAESAAVRQILRPWYPIFNGFRLRTQFEPKGLERRELRRTASISKHIHAMRRICGETGHRFEVRYRSFMVHAVHLGLGWGTASWQAHYNGACFDAIVLQHLEELGA